MRVSAKYEVVKQDFLENLAIEQKKYPLTEREQMFVNVILNLIEKLQEVDSDRYC